MRVGIIGSGDVAKSLAKGFLGRGDEVMLGSRTPEKLAAFAADTGARTGSFAQAAAFGELIVIATLFTGTKEALDAAGDHFAGKVVIDCTNPLDFSKGMPPTLLIGFDDSAGERIQGWLPGARVVKAFNMVGHAHMVQPDFPDGPPTMFIAGDDADAKRVVTGILAAFGWDAVDAGGIVKSRYLEPLCPLWVDYGVAHGSWNHAFKLLRK